MAGTALKSQTAVAAPSDDLGLPPDAARTLEDLHRAAQRENTVQAYASGLRYWIAWHQARFGSLLPIAREVDRAAVPIATVRTFIADHSIPKDSTHLAMPEEVHAALVRALRKPQRGHAAQSRTPVKWNTVRLRIEALAYAHRVYDLPLDVRHGRIKQDLKALRESLAKASLVAPERATPIRRRELSALLGACDLTTPAGLRDRAMFLFGWARRPSETVGAQLADLTLHGPGQWCYTLRRAKNLEAGQQRYLFHTGTAFEAIEDWLACRASLPGASDNAFLFSTLVRPTAKDPRWRLGEGGVSYRAYAANLKRYAAAAGVVATRGRRITLQGLRRGFVSESDGRLTLPQTRAITLHESTRMIVEVYTEQEGMSNPGAALYDLEGGSR